MQDKPLTVKQAAFCKCMFIPGSGTFGNGTESARKAQYKGNTGTLQSVAAENMLKPVIIAEKTRIEAITNQKLGWDRDIALKELRRSLAYLNRRVSDGDVGAVTARTAVIREMNDITGLHQQQPILIPININHNTVQTEADLLRKRLGLIDRMAEQPTGIERN